MYINAYNFVIRISVTKKDVALLAVDHSARGSMKNAANCDN